ncbi:hypothetical protein QR680_011904 [Steinernema hermaphroditum]|uniref:Uncharacterized protein n=1 Tax=Steinernema hermaphroditum TaxID=289476 RepID=A0AA39LZS2_9BILA|nr:hypothetical protein QR680_011904 [Steinernema hermaphroditum]
MQFYPSDNSRSRDFGSKVMHCDHCIDWNDMAAFTVRLAIVVVAIAILYMVVKPRPYIACTCRIGRSSPSMMSEYLDFW